MHLKTLSQNSRRSFSWIYILGLLTVVLIWSCNNNKDVTTPQLQPDVIGVVNRSEVMNVKKDVELKNSMGTVYIDFVERAFNSKSDFHIKSREILKMQSKFYLKTSLVLDDGQKGTVFTELSVDKLGNLRATRTGWSCKSDGSCKDCTAEQSSGQISCYCGSGGNGCKLTID